VAPHTILQFVDSSVHSLAAVELVAALPLPAGSQVVLLAAECGVGRATRPLSPGTQARARNALENRRLRVLCPVLPGDATRHWRSLADEHRPDLIVVSANDLRSESRASPGGLAHQVVEESRWPVLVARAPCRGLGRILLAVDGSSASQSATDLLARLPLPSEAEMRVLHLIAPEPLAELTVPGWPTGARLIPPGPSLAGIAAWDRHAWWFGDGGSP
jgi:nucleotide-binding universal stress UspA family protein